MAIKCWKLSLQTVNKVRCAHKAYAVIAQIRKFWLMIKDLHLEIKMICVQFLTSFVVQGKVGNFYSKGSDVNILGFKTTFDL